MISLRLPIALLALLGAFAWAGPVPIPDASVGKHAAQALRWGRSGGIVAWCFLEGAC